MGQQPKRCPLYVIEYMMLTHEKINGIIAPLSGRINIFYVMERHYDW